MQLAITSVWKVQFLQSKHFSVANNELFHKVCLTQKKLPTQIWPFFVLVPYGLISMKRPILGKKIIFELSIPCE